MTPDAGGHWSTLSQAGYGPSTRKTRTALSLRPRNSLATSHSQAIAATEGALSPKTRPGDVAIP
eukprot:6492549-Alexandrium_andersonii.AAC.1